MNLEIQLFTIFSCIWLNVYRSTQYLAESLQLYTFLPTEMYWFSLWFPNAHEHIQTKHHRYIAEQRLHQVTLSYNLQCPFTYTYIWTSVRSSCPISYKLLSLFKFGMYQLTDVKRLKLNIDRLQPRIVTLTVPVLDISLNKFFCPAVVG